MLFRKDKNKVDGNFISDVLIGLALTQLGKSNESILSYIGKKQPVKEHKVPGENGESTLVLESKLSNGCTIMFTFGKKGAYKIVTFLNCKLIKADIRNLEAANVLKKDTFNISYGYGNESKKYRIIIHTTNQELLDSIPKSFRIT